MYQGKEELEGTDFYDFHARNYHAALGRFMSVDPVYNGPSGYVWMLNNPVSTVDPNGQEPISLTAIAIAVAISGVGYTASIALSDGGFNNWDWGQFEQSLAIGAVSGVAAYGIGTVFQNAYGAQLTFGQQVLKSAVHAHIQGGISEVTGGDYLTGAAAGFAGGVVSGSIGNATQGWTSEFGRSGLEIGSSMLMGGISAEIAQDGEFWRGAAVAGIVAHRLGDNRLEKTKKDQSGGDNGGGDGSYNALLERAKRGGDYAGYASGVLGTTQIGMFEYRQGLSLNSKVGTFSRFRSIYGGLGTASRTLGRISTATVPLAVYLDYSAMSSGQIGIGRFAYRTVGVGASIGTGAAVGSSLGGYWGAAAGAATGGIWWMVEQAYDGG